MKGFGNKQHPDSIGPNVPGFADHYIRENPDNLIAKELKDKVDWCRQKTGHIIKSQTSQDISDEQKENMPNHGKELLSYQLKKVFLMVASLIRIISQREGENDCEFFNALSNVYIMCQ